MRRSDLSRMVREAVKKSLKEAVDLASMDPSDRDELAYSQHLDDLNGNTSQYSDKELEDIKEFLKKIFDKLSKATSGNIDRNTLAHVLELLEQADDLLYQGGLVEEGFGETNNRSATVSQIQLQGKIITTSAAGSTLPDGALAAVAANLKALTNKLKGEPS